MFKTPFVVVAVLLSISAAQAAEWKNMTGNSILNRDNAYTAAWVKQETNQHCVIGVNKSGTIEAVIFRGSILENNLKGIWHMAEYTAPNVAYVKEKGLKLGNMYGSMIVGMEMADLNAFKRQCEGLPPL